jgi:Tol biopolymer transport system component
MMSLDRRLRDELGEEAAAIKPELERHLGAVEAGARRRRGVGPSTLLIAAAIVASAIILRLPNGLENASGKPGRPITPSPGASAAAGVASPAASPSVAVSYPPAQGQIVFDDNAVITAQQQIYIEQADGSALRQLVTSRYDDFNPVVSRDGTSVVFSRYLSQDSVGIFVVKVDGTGLRQIDKASCVQPCLADTVEGDAWSPDGTQIAFTRVLTSATGQIADVGVWVMKADGSGAYQVTGTKVPVGSQDGQASWSPDGKHLVFQRNLHKSSGTAIFTVATDGSDLRQVTPWELGAGDPSWSPDGTLILFQSPADSPPGIQQEICTIHPDGTGLSHLTSGMKATIDDNRQASSHASWSPDGSQIVFTHFPASTINADLFIMNRDGSQLHTLGATPANEDAPDWGPAPAR